MKFSESDDSPYPLRLTATNAAIDYSLYEVSACTVGILTREHLCSRDYLFMEAVGRRIPLRVSAILPPFRVPQGPVVKRYRLTCLDCLMELDRILMPDFGTPNGLQFPRCPVNPRVYVEARWPHREQLEILESVDISRSGLLLRVVRGDDHAALAIDSVVALRLDVARLWLPESLQPWGRLVRAFPSYDEFKTFSYIAVQLIDFSQRDAAHWNQLLRRIERGFLSGLSKLASSKL
ncbi:hypothetical protein [Oligoflexus tunisiensis]|uniref:hypothetical protein n=1 Tax=Oligoflexus tunisiensis TaxID=708132 RepID=UPI00114C9C9F|nr:hypothetical protein [Oligoflexus tunisiensis]